jgi:integrase
MAVYQTTAAACLDGCTPGRKQSVSTFFVSYHFEDASREMPLGIWPRVTLAAIRLQLDETKLRVQRGNDPANQRKLVAKKLKVEKAQIIRQQQELAEHERQHAKSELTMTAMFKAWHSEATVDNTLDGAKAVRRMFELHLLPHAGNTRLIDLTPGVIRKAIRTLIDVKKISTAISLHVYANAMFAWAAKRKPWRQLFDVNPVEEVDIERMLPADYQDWCERVLEDDEIIELRNRFQIIRNTWDFHAGPRRGIARPIPREHELAVWITLATLVRINEICAAQWRAHIDFEKATWFIPASQSKNRKPFTIHLSAFALRLLRELHTLTGHTPYLLPHTKDAGKPVTTAILQCAIGSRQSHGKQWARKNRNNQNAEVTARSLVLDGGPWSWHDLRRTGATLMQACGIDETIVDRCLNHSHFTVARNKRIDPRLLKTYQRYDYEKEMCNAWRALGEYLTNLDGTRMQISGPAKNGVAANDAGTAPLQIDAA